MSYNSKCYTEAGKVLAHLRVGYLETLRKQADRLGFNAMYLSQIQCGKKGFSFEVYRSVLDHYPVTDEQKRILQAAVCGEDVYGRFREVVGDSCDVGRLMYILYGREN